MKKLIGFLLCSFLLIASTGWNKVIAQENDSGATDTAVVLPSADITTSIATATTGSVTWTIVFIALGLIAFWTYAFRTVQISKQNANIPTTPFAWGKWFSDWKNWTAIILYVIVTVMMLKANPVWNLWIAFAWGAAPMVPINWLLKELQRLGK